MNSDVKFSTNCLVNKDKPGIPGTIISEFLRMSCSVLLSFTLTHLGPLPEIDEEWMNNSAKYLWCSMKVTIVK